jgi:SAM-dependent methyltransferase
MPSPEVLSAYYEAAYGDGRYTPFADAREIRTLIARHRLERILALLPGNADGDAANTAPSEPARGLRWLDVGCAAGDTLAAAAAAGARAEGIDISESAVERVRERGLVARAARIESFRPDEPYHVISAFDLLEHVLDPRGVVRRLREWLVPGGHLVLTLPDVRSAYPRFLMRRHWFYYWPDEHLFYFDPRTITRLLTQEGFAEPRVTRAWKPLTLAYAASSLGYFNAVLGPLATRLVGALPAALCERPIPLYLGEMMVVARRPETRA